jgi:pyruvate formate lyase activating enzyme
MEAATEQTHTPTANVHLETEIKEAVGNVHSYESMSCVDGPGMRYIVFLQGCTKRCVFCANPDTIAYAGGTPTSSKEVAQKLANIAS